MHVSSVVNFRATPSTSVYTASKSALAGLTRQMAAEYGPRRIRCNAVAPGLVENRLDQQTNYATNRNSGVSGPTARRGRAWDGLKILQRP